MISINLPTALEKHFMDVIQENYDGDLPSAIAAFLKLHEKYGWKEQLLEDVKSVRSEVRRKGGIKAETIDQTIRKYRYRLGESGV
jgi:flavodoxin